MIYRIQGCSYDYTLYQMSHSGSACTVQLQVKCRALEWRGGAVGDGVAADEDGPEVAGDILVVRFMPKLAAANVMLLFA